MQAFTNQLDLSICMLSWNTAQQVRAYLTETKIHWKSGFLHPLQEKADQLLHHRLHTGDKEVDLRTITTLH